MKKIFLIILLGLLVAIPARGELSVNLGGFYANPFTIDDFSLNSSFTDTDDIVSFNEINRSLFDNSGGFGFNAGIAFFFNYKMGLGVNASFMKTSFDINNSFNWNWEWWDNDQGSINAKSWMNKGTVSAIPISVNIIYRAVSTDKMKVNLFAGPTLFLANIELDGNGGYADGPLLYEGSYYIDWYDIPLEVSASESVFGGNGGIELEYMLSESMNIYVSATYYFAGELDLNWMVKTGQYTGEFGSLVATISNPDLLPGYSVPVKLSTFTLGFGIKVYL
ncbi:MAG: outer membrane beta-barrel protein [Acidobacteriota bacterium]